jgi:hypothetical protein
VASGKLDPQRMRTGSCTRRFCSHYDHSKLGSVLSAINGLKAVGKHIVIGCTVTARLSVNLRTELTWVAFSAGAAWLHCQCRSLLVARHEGLHAQVCSPQSELHPNPSLLLVFVPATTLSSLRKATSSTASSSLTWYEAADRRATRQRTLRRKLTAEFQVLIGEGSKAAGDRLEGIYHQLCDNKPRMARMSAESAEICKLGVNCFVTMKVWFLFSATLDLLQSSLCQQIKVTFSNLIGDIADRCVFSILLRAFCQPLSRASSFLRARSLRLGRRTLQHARRRQVRDLLSHWR